MRLDVEGPLREQLALDVCVSSSSSVRSGSPVGVGLGARRSRHTDAALEPEPIETHERPEPQSELVEHFSTQYGSSLSFGW